MREIHELTTVNVQAHFRNARSNCLKFSIEIESTSFLNVPELQDKSSDSQLHVGVEILYEQLLGNRKEKKIILVLISSCLGTLSTVSANSVCPTPRSVA